MIIASDIHNHLLPGVDDGFKLRAESLEAIHRLSDAGCSCLTFTPHMNPEIYSNTEESIRLIYSDFIKDIPSEWGVETALAGEYMIVRDFEERASEDLLCYSDGSILIEMSYYFRSENLEKTVFELSMAGHSPILAHPERYIYMSDSLSDFDRLHDMGCKFQMNAMSLTGCYGKGSIHILEYLLKKGYYAHVATDLHSLHQLDQILSIEPRRRYRKRLVGYSTL